MSYAEPLNELARPLDTDGLKNLVSRLKNKRIVMLGESSHGTSEFYTLRARISEMLIRDHGFQFIAVEGDWPDASRLSDYIETGGGGSARDVLTGIRRWPTWMWANEEVARLGENLRRLEAGFHGLDVYSLFESIEEALMQIRKIDSGLAEQLAERYRCFDRFNRDEIAYARSLLRSPLGCEEQVIENLRNLLAIRVERETGYEKILLEAQQNARVVRNAEAYYRAMLRSDESSWNLRDEHMLETLDALLDFHGPSSKAIVWAHNTHVGDYRATDMVIHQLVNIGGLAREKYGEDAVALVGFGTGSGTVMAGRAWGAKPQVMRVPNPKAKSLEARLRKVSQALGQNTFFIPTRETIDALPQAIGHRAIGVVYDPDHEGGNYVPTLLHRRYDAFVYVDESKAVSPLHAIPLTHEIPETWPSGQ